MNTSLNSSYRSTKSKNERIQEVRKQEKEFSKQIVIDHKKNEILQKQQDDRDKKQKEYQDKLKEIQSLQEIKERALMEIGEAQRKAVEQSRLESDKQQAKQDKMKHFQEMSQIRYKEAQDWNKTQVQESEEGRYANRISQMKEASIMEKQREQSMLDTFKLTRKEYEQSMLIDYNALLEKNKKSYLKPEDFARTNFHNPSTIKHEMDDQKENAIDKANSIFIESQPQLEQTARLWREQERTQKQRGMKALSKEREKKVIQDLDNETKYLKKQFLEENIKSMENPFLKKSSQTKMAQELLSRAFNSLVGDKKETKKYGEWNDKSQKKRNISLDKSLVKHQKSERTKSVKVFSKVPTEDYKSKEDSTNRADYTNYPLVSPETHDYEPQSEKKKVTFLVPQNKEQATQELKQSKDKLNFYLQQQEQNLELDSSESISDQNEESNQKSSETTRPVQDIKDMRSYIKEQEDYLQRLESERIRLTNSMHQEEQTLIQTFRKTNKLINKEIPEEDDSRQSSQNSEIQDNYQESLQASGNTYQNVYETDDQSASNSNPSYLNAQQQFNQERKKPQMDNYVQRNDQFASPQGHHYTFQNPLQQVNSPAQPSQEGLSVYEYSPESRSQSELKQDNYDTQDMMMRFLKPQNNQFNLASTQMDNQIKHSQEKQQNRFQKITLSPGSELSYSLSELEKSNEKHIHRMVSQSNKNNILIQDTNTDQSSTPQRKRQQYQQQEEQSNDSQSQQFSGYKNQFTSGSMQKKNPLFESDDPSRTDLESKGLNYTYVNEQQQNLGDIFQRRKAELNKKYMEKQNKEEEKVGKIQKTKEQLLELRKQMMKRPKKQSDYIEKEEQKEQKEQKVDPLQDQKILLMQRLAMGTKVKIEKKEMMALTNKNYDQLPEIRKKKIEQEKKDEYKRRQEKVKELDVKTRQKLKNN